MENACHPERSRGMYTYQSYAWFDYVYHDIYPLIYV